MDQLADLARDYADGLVADGLTVFHAAEDRFVPIPAMLTPEIVEDEAFDAYATDARRLLTATMKAARWTVGKPVAARLYGGLTPLEQRALATDRYDALVTARVDGFAAIDGVRVLEINATIPAMQGYSDIVAHRWIRTVGAGLGLPDARIEAIVGAAGSSTADLLASLVAGYERQGGREVRPSILIVSRRGDSQLGELRHYEKAWTASGHRALHVWVDEVALDAGGRVTARGERFDLVYRHIFARRVDPDLPFARLLVDPGPNVVLNPVTSPLEVKGVLALVSASADDELAAGMGLAPEERAAIARRVPWTRLLTSGPTTLPDGSSVADLVAWVAAHPSRLVIKRSWDYGGKGVILGPETEPRAWAARVAEAARDAAAWVVQGYVEPPLHRHLAVRGGLPEWRDVYVDRNAFVSLQTPFPMGGVARASASRIVNIASGGGLVPFLRRSTAESLAGWESVIQARSPVVMRAG